MRSLSLFALLFAGTIGALAAPFTTTAPGTVTVKTPSQGSYVGQRSDVADEFLGIPYATPPVGELRFARPRPLAPSSATRQALQPGAACLQATAVDTPKEYAGIKFSEDCLFLNVHRPRAASSNKPLPVVVNIHGGAWMIGAGIVPGFSSLPFISRSVELGEPVIFVSLNYRLSGFGFLAGPEMDVADQQGTATLNAGYWDQRLALRWVQENIVSFGGDPARVTLMGQSAGANSVAAQMLANGGQTEGLFRAAILSSGSQATAARDAAAGFIPRLAYGALLLSTKCFNLDCLRKLPADKLLSGLLKITNLTALPVPFIPVRDRFFCTQLPSAQFAAGSYPNLPIIMGNVLDEGTMWVLPELAVADPAFALNVEIFSGPPSALAFPQLAALYPNDPKLGSPFRPELSGNNASYRFYEPSNSNQYKRIAAAVGDILFTAGRRQQLQAMSKRVDAWSYLFSQPDAAGIINKPASGVVHGADFPYALNDPPAPFKGPVTNSSTAAAQLYANPTAVKRTADIMSAAWIHFINNMSPAGADVPAWPKYSEQAQMLQIQGDKETKIITDDFRVQQTQFILANSRAFQI